MDEAPRWFVLIGAQKAGTTSLHEDLRSLEGIDIPDTKERGWFNSDRIYSRREQRRFTSAYRDDSAVLRGDVSTSYSKRDEFPGVPERVKSVLGADAKIIYLLRSPIERTISQHQYESRLNLMSANFSEALESAPSLVRNSEYGHQLESWVEHFPMSQILLVDFHRYVEDRLGVVGEIADFLAYPHEVLPTTAMTEAHNPTLGALSPTGLFASVLLSKPYIAVKGKIPKRLRDGVRRKVLTANETLPSGPTDAEVGTLSQKFKLDADALAALAGGRAPNIPIKRPDRLISATAARSPATRLRAELGSTTRTGTPGRRHEIEGFKMSDQNAARTAYTKSQAETYDEMRFATRAGKLIHQREWAHVLRLFDGLSDEGRALEVGCGTGRLLLEGRTLGHRVDGADASAAMVKEVEAKANGRYPDIELEVAEAADLPWDDHEFSLVYSVRLLNQTESPEYALRVVREMIRVAQPDASVLVEFINVWRPRFGPSKNPTVRLRPSEVAAAAQKAGATEVDIEGSFFFGMAAYHACPTRLLTALDAADHFLSRLLPRLCSRCYAVLRTGPAA